MADNKKKFTLQAYDIENEEIGKAYSDLQEKLKEKLEAREIADIRRMKLNPESPEEDLLSDFAITERYVFGVMCAYHLQKRFQVFQKDFLKILRFR